MTESAHLSSRVVLAVGLTILASMLIRAGCRRVRIPALVGFLLLGVVLRATDERITLLSQNEWGIYRFLADLGVIALLFRVGLESKPQELLGQLRRASGVWVADVGVSGVFGFLAARYLLGLALAPSLIVATALTATSVGVSVGVWQARQALQTPQGEVLLDVAELDDITAVILMALLFSLLPVLQGGATEGMGIVLLKTAGMFLLRLVLFGGCCIVFARYVERPVTDFFARRKPADTELLVVLGVGIVIAALAGLIGFSVAIGAFFAGLIFSRDPQSVKLDASFAPLHDLFMPFFFIGIGLHVSPQSWSGALLPGAVLVAAAGLGKCLGVGGASWLFLPKTGALLLGVSMIPRAEISMIVMQRGLSLENGGITDEIFSSMVMVSALTCILAPLALRPLFRRWPPPNSEETA